jgi:Vitamin K-dependent gamma-carboxylase
MTLFKSRSARALARTEDFFLLPAASSPLACLRVLVSVLLLVQALILNRWVVDFLSRDGLIQGPLSDLLRNPYLPHVGWFADAVAPFGITEVTTLYAVCFLYVLSLVLLALGFMTRTAAIATWFLHWVLVITGYTSAYGVDLYAHVFLFYMMFMPLGDSYSLDAYFSGQPIGGQPSSSARLSLRVIQFQLCISYFFSAYEKVVGEQWRTGEVLWRMFNLPFFKYVDLAWTAQWPSLLLIGAWATILLEGAFFIFIWPKRTRIPWLIGMLGLHLGIAAMMGLHLFGLIMCIFLISGFAIPYEPSVATEPVATTDESSAVVLA